MLQGAQKNQEGREAEALRGREEGGLWHVHQHGRYEGVLGVRQLKKELRRNRYVIAALLMMSFCTAFYPAVSLRFLERL